MVVGTFPFLLVPVLAGRDPLSLTLVAALFVLAATGVQLSGVQAMTLRRAITPEHLLGRMTASYRFLTWGGMPVRALLGGILATAAGARGPRFSSPQPGSRPLPCGCCSLRFPDYTSRPLQPDLGRFATGLTRR
jgi:hypothetical protein